MPFAPRTTSTRSESIVSRSPICSPWIRGRPIESIDAGYLIQQVIDVGQRLRLDLVLLNDRYGLRSLMQRERQTRAPGARSALQSCHPDRQWQKRNSNTLENYSYL